MGPGRATARQIPTSIRVVAHRGASGYAPENTLTAFALAVEMGVSAIELDVHLSRDGEIVIIHDPQVDGTTDGTGTVADLTLTQLKQLDAGRWFNRLHPKNANPQYAGQKIPTLQEAINLVAPTDVGLYIEIKDPDLYSADFEERIVSLIQQDAFQNRVVVLSFSAESIQKVRGLDSSIQTGLLAGTLKTDPIARAIEAGAHQLAIRRNLLTDKILRRARAEGLVVTVWTVNTRSEIRRALAFGIDGIISNYPDRVLHLISE